MARVTGYSRGGHIRVWHYVYQLYITGVQGQGQFLLLELVWANVDMGAGFTDTNIKTDRFKLQGLSLPWRYGS